MKWTKTPRQHGERVIKTWFAWWPVRVWNEARTTSETRWLETVTVEAEYRISPTMEGNIPWWHYIRFVD